MLLRGSCQCGKVRFRPPSHVHLMLRSKPDWVPALGRGPRFPEYPERSIAEWHARHGLDGSTGRRKARPRQVRPS